MEDLNSLSSEELQELLLSKLEKETYKISTMLSSPLKRLAQCVFDGSIDELLNELDWIGEATDISLYDKLNTRSILSDKISSSSSSNSNSSSAEVSSTTGDKVYEDMSVNMIDQQALEVIEKEIDGLSAAKSLLLKAQAIAINVKSLKSLVMVEIDKLSLGPTSSSTSNVTSASFVSDTVIDTDSFHNNDIVTETSTDTASHTATDASPPHITITDIGTSFDAFTDSINITETETKPETEVGVANSTSADVIIRLSVNVQQVRVLRDTVYSILQSWDQISGFMQIRIEDGKNIHDSNSSNDTIPSIKNRIESRKLTISKIKDVLTDILKTQNEQEGAFVSLLAQYRDFILLVNEKMTKNNDYDEQKPSTSSSSSSSVVVESSPYSSQSEETSSSPTPALTDFSFGNSTGNSSHENLNQQPQPQSQSPHEKRHEKNDEYYRQHFLQHVITNSSFVFLLQDSLSPLTASVSDLAVCLNDPYYIDKLKLDTSDGSFYESEEDNRINYTEADGSHNEYENANKILETDISDIRIEETKEKRISQFILTSLDVTLFLIESLFKAVGPVVTGTTGNILTKAFISLELGEPSSKELVTKWNSFKDRSSDSVTDKIMSRNQVASVNMTTTAAAANVAIENKIAIRKQESVTRQSWTIVVRQDLE